MKKYLLVLVVYSLVFIGLTACTIEYTPSISTPPINDEITGGEVDSEIVDNEQVVIHEFTQNHYVARCFRYPNQLLLIDLVTGKNVVSYEFGEYDAINQIWELGDYIIAWVGLEDLWSRTARLYGWDSADGVFDERTQEEREFRLVIFDTELNYIESLPFIESRIALGWGSSVLRVVNGELFVYGWEMTRDGSNGDMLEINANTGMVNRLFVGDNSLRLHDFVADNQILVTAFNSPSQAGGATESYTSYGILDLINGETTLFRVDDFAHNFNGVSLSGHQVLLLEQESVFWGHDYQANRVIVFDLTDHSTKIVPLGDGDSLIAQISDDGNHVVSVNFDAQRLRKFDMSGNLLSEVAIEIPEMAIRNNVNIFPVNENQYAIVFQVPVFLDNPNSNGRTIIFLDLP